MKITTNGKIISETNNFLTTKNKPMATTTYKRIAAGVSKEGSIYRVRVQKNGVRKSKFFTTRKAALEFRKKLG